MNGSVPSKPPPISAPTSGFAGRIGRAGAPTGVSLAFLAASISAFFCAAAASAASAAAALIVSMRMDCWFRALAWSEPAREFGAGSALRL
eukprot:30918-Pelagococcus_subviridis.AAC.38